VLRFALAKRLTAHNLLYFQDFPVTGVAFQDLSLVLANPDLLKLLNFAMSYHINKKLGWTKDAQFVAGIDARGFIYGSMVASELNLGFLMIRKKGKLPGDKVVVNYDTEYSNADIEVMKETVNPGDKFIIMDDLQATGGSMRAAVEILTAAGAEIVGTYCVLEVVP